MKYALLTQISLLLFSCTSDSNIETSLIDTNDTYCDSVCRGLILEGEYREAIQMFSPLDPVNDSVLVNKYVKEKDSLYTLLKSLDLESDFVGFYTDEYRNECLQCWADQISADISDMALAAAKADQKLTYPAPFLLYSFESVRSPFYSFDDRGNPYYMQKGKRIMVTDTVQNKIDLKLEVDLLIAGVDTIIEPIFGKGILNFSPDELILYNSLTEYDQALGTIPIQIKPD